MLCLIFAAATITGVFAGYTVNARAYGNVRDPTFQESLEFVRSDQTDRNEYNQTYTCFNFASDFVNNALKEGYRSAYVIIEFPDEKHAIVAFDTSDRGLIFIEPQTDELVTLTVGQQYMGRTVVRFSVDWPSPYEPASILLLSMLFLPSFTMLSLLTITALNGKQPSEIDAHGHAQGESASEPEH